ncbi:MAG: hypothetical protein JRI55_18290 [Deltaproteobacteria bacterium]|nr:hypothetical protein [Deltaproteobacteria bacterium]
MTARAIRMDEVAAGAINHRLECFWHATGRPNDSTPWYYWPLAGYESGKGGIVPEGLVLRIKPSVNLDGRGLSTSELVIARAMQQYGCVIGDNDGGTKNSLKLERDKLGDDCVEAPCSWKEAAPDLRYSALEAFAWDDYEFVLGGFDPR